MFLFRRLTVTPSVLISSCRIRHEKRWFSKLQHGEPQAQLQKLVKADLIYLERKKYDGILKLYPQAKNVLHNVFHSLKTKLDSSYTCHVNIAAVGKIHNKLVFQGCFTVNWPKPLTFSGYGLRKKDAEYVAMVKALELLYEENLITSEGNPVTFSQEEKEKFLDEMSCPPTIEVPSHLLDEGFDLLQKFEKEVQPLKEQGYKTSSFVLQNNFEESEDEELPNSSCSEEVDEMFEQEEVNFGTKDKVIDLLTGREYAEDPDSNEYRSREMLKYHSFRVSRADDRYAKQSLPMSKYADDLERALDKHQVVIVAGDTGCGKSTQVPQMVIDKWTLDGRGANCNILVSQPRRISAISLAKYIAHERKEELGESVGYHVRFSYKPLHSRGGIMCLTTGMLLQELHRNPTLEGVSHVIVDEVHEQSVSTNLLLILLRRLIRTNDSLKLILMSASLSITELEKYFGEMESALIEVPGTLYPLDRHYLQSTLSELELSPSRYQLQPLISPGSWPIINLDLVLDVIKRIDNTRPPGAILCFLPGWQDIDTVQRRLKENPDLADRLLVLPLHSRLSSADQEKIFQSAPGTLRKVVLATNIAETSLTVEDVCYVIDTGCHKEQRYDSRRDLSVLGSHWISKANGTQRAGRAGRVKPGEVFHLYSEDIHQNMSLFPVPEVMRIPLEYVVLQCKAHCREESALTFLSEGINVPNEKFINAALRNLEDLGILSFSKLESMETLTTLGQRVVHFSSPPHLSKAIIYSSIFRCVDPILSISAAMSGSQSIFNGSIEMRSEIRQKKLNVNPSSDLLAMLGLIEEWEEIPDYEDKIYFCNKNYLSHRGLLSNKGIKKIYGDQLKYGLMIDSKNIWPHNSDWNLNSQNEQLLLGVLLAAVNRILLLQRGILSKGFLLKDRNIIKTLEGSSVKTGSDCVLHTNQKSVDEISRHLLCVHLSRDNTSHRTIARDLSLLQPLTVVLFAGKSLKLTNKDDSCILTVDGKQDISFQVDARTGNFLLELRNAVDQMVDIILETRGLDVQLPENFDYLCNKIVQYVSNIVKKQKSKSESSSLFDDDDNDL